MRFKEAFTTVPLPQVQEAPSDIQPLDFISAGVACHAFALLERLGILDILNEKGYFELKEHSRFKNGALIKAALKSLKASHILVKEKNRYSLTALGQQLFHQRGLITMVYDGYGSLIARQVEIAQGKVPNPSKYINWSSVAQYSIQFGEDKVDPLVIDVIKNLKPKRTICDLGCGTADRLVKVCQAMGLPGLGLDNNLAAVQLGIKLTKDIPSVTVEKANVAQLKGVWEDVEILMQSFVMHDIIPFSECVHMLKSYLEHFPHFKYLVVVDIVTSEDALEHMPGFDYVHGLQGIEPRSYKEMMAIFQKANYTIKKEIPVGMPNTYLWILSRS